MVVGFFGRRNIAVIAIVLFRRKVSPNSEGQLHPVQINGVEHT